MELLQQCYDVAAEAEVVLERRGREQAAGEIATQGHDVADAPRVVRLCGGRKLRSGVVDRGQVRHDREAEVVLEQGRHLGGAFPRAAPRTVGHRHEVRRYPTQRRGGLPQRLDAGLVLGREELQRAQGTLLGE